MRAVKKLLFANLILVIIVLGLSSCRSESNKLNSNSSSIDKNNIQKIKLALWDYNDVEYDKKLIEAFSKRYPNIQVEVLSFPGVQYDKKLAVMLEGVSDIDVFYVRTENQLINLTLNNHIKTIDDLITRDSVNLNQYNKIGKIDNKIYGLPYRSDFQVLYYNKDIFENNKIPFPTNDITWEEYRNLGKRLTTVNGKDKTYGIFMMGLYIPLKNIKGEKFDSTKSDLNMLRPNIELLLNIQKVDKSAVDYGTNKSLNVNQLTFEKGDSAMFINGTWFTNYLVKDRESEKFNFNWGITKIPHWKGESQSDAISITPVCINSKTTNLEAAWTFEKFITGKEGAEILAREIILPGYIDQHILSEFNKNPGLPKGSETVFNFYKTKNYEIISTARHRVNGVIAEETENILMKGKSVDAAILDMTKRRDEIISSSK